MNVPLWLCVACILATPVLAQLAGASAEGRLRDQTGLTLRALAGQIADQLDRGMFERYRQFQLIAARPTLGDPAVSVADKQRLLDETQRAHASYSWIGATDVRGKVLAASGGVLAGADVSKRPWFVDAFRDINVGDVHDAKLLASKLPNPAGEPMRFVDVAFPYRAPDGAVAGILGAHIAWKWAGEVERALITPTLAQTGIDALIIARDATVLLGPTALLGSTLETAGAAAVREGRSGFGVDSTPEGRRYIVGYAPTRGMGAYPGLGWSVIVRADEAQAYAPVRALRYQVLGLGFGAALILLLFGLNAARAQRGREA